MTLNFGLTVAGGYFHTADTNFGAGRQTDGRETIDWMEGFVKPAVTAAMESTEAGTFYGGLAYVGTISAGDGDAGGFTPSHTQALDNEDLYIGWRSGRLLESLGTDAIDVSFGRQDFHVGSGFLIWDGNYDTGHEGTYRLLARSAFERAALLRVNVQRLHVDLFYLKADRDNGRPQLYGANVEYTAADFGTLAASGFKIFDATPEFATRDGLRVLNARAGAQPLTRWGIADFHVAGEYVREDHDSSRHGVAASAWYAEVSYKWVSVPWSPALKYRYSAFTGDDPATTRSEAFDPLFYSYSTDWDTWIQGEITGSYLLFNSNDDVQLVHASVQPLATLTVGVMYWNFTLDQPATLADSFKGGPYTHVPSAKDFADEIDLYTDWTINRHLSVNGVFGIALPDAAAQQAVGASHDYKLIELYMTLTL